MRGRVPYTLLTYLIMFSLPDDVLQPIESTWGDEQDIGRIYWYTLSAHFPWRTFGNVHYSSFQYFKKALRKTRNFFENLKKYEFLRERFF